MSQVTSWLNEFIAHGSYPFEVVSSDPSIKISEEKTRFPDVQVWLNRRAGQGFCGWELKTPETPSDEPKLLQEAAEKARAMEANYFVTWNMRDAVIWRTPREGAEVTREHKAYSYNPIYQVSCADDLWDKSKNILLRDRAKAILDDLATLHREGHLHQVDIDATFFVKRLKDAVDSLGPHIHASLTARVGKYPKFREKLFDWAVEQGITRFGDEAFYNTVSRQIAYRLLGKVLFYQTLRRYRNDIPKMELSAEDFSKISERLKEFFEKARQIDYQAVFEEDLPDKVPLSPQSGKVLAELLDDLNRCNFSRMPQDVIGQVFERLIPYPERHSLGQYFTREDLVDLINAFCIRSLEDKILDPTCGTGTFLIRAYERLKHMGERDHKKLISRLWGIDVAKFPAALATINLYKQDLNDYANFPRIISQDFFNTRPGDVFKFPPPKPTSDPSFMIEENLPIFDAAVGNFPYIRQELIEKRLKGYKKKLQEVLTEDWLKEYRELFDNKNIPHLSGQADIYAYLFFHLPRFLKEDGGRMGIVTSSAWLEVEYGHELQRFFLKNFKIIAVLESMVENWFEDVPVITTATILERCKDTEKRNKHLVKFVKVKKRLKDLIPYDMRLEAVNRFPHLDRLVYKIERAGEEHFKLEGTRIVNTLKGLKTYEDEDFRIRVIRQGELLGKIEETCKTAKWGKYLRAPEVYFEILDKCRDKLVPLKEVAEIRRGYTTGINEFFYLTKNQIRHWGIEKEFLAPVIKSPKESQSILLSKDNLDTFVFLCHLSKNDLKKTHKNGALSYIQWGEQQVTRERKGKGGGVKYPDAPTVKGRKLWYALPIYELGQIYWTKSYDDTFLQRFSRQKLVADQRVYQVGGKHNVKPETLAAILNSTLFSLFVELGGRVNLGEGALDTTVEEVQEEIYCPDIRLFDKEISKKINQAFDNLLTRPIKPIFEEVKEKDRQRLDSLVLQAIGLDPKKYLKPIYDGLCELVRERIELARMRKKVQQARTERDVEKIKEQLLSNILPEGPKKFPEEFLPSLKKEDFQEISIPASPLKLGRYFFGRQEVISEDGFNYQARSVEEAKFIIYSQRPDSFIVRVPKNDIAISKAVMEYEKYLRELKDEFFAAFFQRIHDHKQADALTQVIFQEQGLPEVAGS
ncbi:MAG TPA: HsdM family class I SAM-dependent methyltransferase [Candidatus Hypogeohydataceae bacterium YC41]